MKMGASLGSLFPKTVRMMVSSGLAGAYVQPCPRIKLKDESMRTMAVLFGFAAAVAVSIKLVGFTSAAQGQKTIVFALILAAVFCPLSYWLVGKVVGSVR